MPSVVTRGCTKCKKCLSICPVEPFHEGIDTLVINPKICIDCGSCILECPIGIIYAQEDVPKHLGKFIKINARKSKIFPVLKNKP